jgi:hypothetical protein
MVEPEAVPDGTASCAGNRTVRPERARTLFERNSTQSPIGLPLRFLNDAESKPAE